MARLSKKNPYGRFKTGKRAEASLLGPTNGGRPSLFYYSTSEWICQGFLKKNFSAFCTKITECRFFTGISAKSSEFGGFLPLFP